LVIEMISGAAQNSADHTVRPFSKKVLFAKIEIIAGTYSASVVLSEYPTVSRPVRGRTRAVMVRIICAADDMPNKATVLRPEFQDAYGTARQLQTELMAEEILEIADDVTRDTILTEQGPRLNAEGIARSKLRVDARKWLMSKLAPKAGSVWS
jgi:hypothetical protein